METYSSCDLRKGQRRPYLIAVEPIQATALKNSHDAFDGLGRQLRTPALRSDLRLLEHAVVAGFPRCVRGPGAGMDECLDLRRPVEADEREQLPGPGQRIGADVFVTQRQY